MIDLDPREIEQRIRHAERRLIAKSGVQSAPVNVVAALMLSAFLFPVAPDGAVAGWIAMMTAVSLARLLILVPAVRSDEGIPGSRWPVYMVLAGLTSLLWGGSAYLVPPEGASAAMQATAIVIAGVSAGAAITSAASLPLVFASTAPGLSLFAVSLFDGRDALSVLLSICVLLFFATIARLAGSFQRTLAEAVSASARLEVAKKQSEAQSHAMTRLAERQEAAARAAESQARAHAAVLANLRHDLRTPLNGVLGLSELLAEHELNEEQERMVARIRESGHQLAELIDDILEVSRLESGQFELNLGDVTARKLSQLAEAFAAPLANRKGLAFEAQVSGEGDRAIRADQARILRLMQVFLSNAVRFTDTGGVVLNISAKPDGEADMRLRVEVRDTGCGVPQNVRDKLFDAFVDSRMDESIKEAGTGLGLLLVKRMSRRMGGDAGYAPAESGAGSVFWFEIAARASAKADRFAAAETVSVDQRRLRIVVAEQDEARRSVLMGHLRAFDCSVTALASGEELLEALGASAYDAVVLGLSLRNSDPAAMALEVRNLPSTASLTPIVRLEEGLSAPLGRSATDVLVRAPVQAETLLEGLHAALAGDPAAIEALARRAAV